MEGKQGLILDLIINHNAQGNLEGPWELQGLGATKVLEFQSFAGFSLQPNLDKGGFWWVTKSTPVDCGLYLFYRKIHLLGSFQNIKIARTAICNLILGKVWRKDPHQEMPL